MQYLHIVFIVSIVELCPNICHSDHCVTLWCLPQQVLQLVPHTGFADEHNKDDDSSEEIENVDDETNTEGLGTALGVFYPAGDDLKDPRKTCVEKMKHKLFLILCFKQELSNWYN